MSTRVNVYHAQSVKGGNVTCHFCKGEHPIYQCSQLLDLTITERKKQVKNHKLCFNCLFNNHQVQNCKSKYSCRKCNERRHTILHQESEQTTNNEVLTAVDTVNNHAFLRNKFVLLSTAIVLVKNSSNQYVECRALLDAGSQSNFISEHMVTKLNLNLHKTNLTVGGINQTISTITQATKVIMKSRVNQSICEQFKCFVVPKITEDLPNDVIDKSLIYIPPNIKLADPLFHKTRPVDLLIGAELFWNLLSDGRISQSGHQLHFQETKLGWVIAGSIKLKESLKTSCHLSALSQSTLEKQVAKFRILEEISHKNNLSSDELQCEDHFQNNFARDENGRFIVRLPFKNNKYDLGSSLEQTKKRFYSVERKLNNSQRELRQPYSNFMKEYLELGHMELVPSGEIDKRNSCYLPHHAVIKDSSTTTKLRVVFDGSSKTSNGLSLNDNLLPGPNLQQDLFLILARFRCFQYVISSDMEKMYRQINIDERDADFQRILWRESVDSPLEIYRLKTVTYGTTSAPFLAMHCIQQLANENINNFPLACATISQCFYMDDLLCGHNTFQETLVLRDQIIEILKQGQFNLRKWASNDPFLLPTVNSETSDNTAINLDKDGDIKTLGLTWNSKEDTLKFVIANSPVPGKITKRSILSTIAKIFDPLGLIAPFVVNAKLVLQKLWQLKLQWDQSVPNPLAEEWHRFLNELCHLSHESNNKKLNKNSRLLSLNPFIDPNDNLLRVGGRIGNSNFSYDKKHQILLPSKHYVTRLLIKQYHEQQLHGGQQLTLAALRQKYWPVAAQSLVRKIIFECVKCFKTHPRRFIPKMGDLPNVRIEPTRPFINVGIDYAGPILIKQGNKRSKPVKSYIALFICLATKAVHMELVGDLTSESFTNALKRILSRRGKVLNIYCDNGTNFVGAKNELQNMKRFLESSEFEVNVLEALKRQNISWHFIPPSSPHMGGIWKSGVKLVKSHLKKILGVSLVTYEEMYTLLTRIEACLNSRPMGQMIPLILRYSLRTFPHRRITDSPCRD
jgi:hypothetical protein